MRKVLTFVLIFTGTILTVFVLNLVMFAVNPDYHDMISAAVASSHDDIPVVTPDMVKEIETSDKALVYPVKEAETSDNVLNSSIKDVETSGKTMGSSVNEVPKKAQESNTSNSAAAGQDGVSGEKKTIVIDKEYHEDCGTGKGYWVITYSDGSVGIE